MGRGFRSEVAVGLMVLVLFVLGAIFFSGTPPVDKVQSLRTWQEADAPPGYMVDASEEHPDGRLPVFEREFALLDAFARFRLPPAVRLDFPLGAENGSFTHVVERFLAGNEATGGMHLGVGIDGLGAEDSDLNEGVRAVGNGVVVYARHEQGGDGGTVILGHRLPDGRHVHTPYGQLQTIEVALGTVVARGEVIGSVANATGSAQLHFEVYEGAMIDPGIGYAATALNRINPADLLASHGPADQSHLAPEPLGVYEVVRQVFRLDSGEVESGPDE